MVNRWVKHEYAWGENSLLMYMSWQTWGEEWLGLEESDWRHLDCVVMPVLACSSKCVAVQLLCDKRHYCCSVCHSRHVFHIRQLSSVRQSMQCQTSVPCRVSIRVGVWSEYIASACDADRSGLFHKNWLYRFSQMKHGVEWNEISNVKWKH